MRPHQKNKQKWDNAPFQKNLKIFKMKKKNEEEIK